MLNWQQVEKLFNQAIEHEPGERAAFVEKECGNDSELQSQVLSLLKSEQKSDTFLDKLSEKIYPIMGAPIIGDIGRYQLLEIIGEGGMGLVYKAFDETLQRTVAIKFLSGIRTHNERDKARFIQEAKTAAQLSHPNVCEVYEVGESEDGSLFIVTAFCEGRDLSILIKENTLTIGVILEILIQLCTALQSAHKKGIIHRDVKPANIIVDDRGLIQLVDFGIAKTIGNDVSVSNQLMGTFAYMSPEQFSGASIDPRTDIWAIGIVLYECLAGVKPYAKDSPAEVMFQIFNAQMPQLKVEGVPGSEAINTILRRCLSIDKQLRFQNSDLLGFELTALKRKLDNLQKSTYVPKYIIDAKQIKENTPTSLNEYRKVVSIGIKLRGENNKASKNTINTIKGRIKKYLGQVSDQKENSLYAYFGFPKLGEGSADNALACALSILELNLNDSQNTEATAGKKIATKIEVERIVVDNTPIVISSDLQSHTQKIQGDLPGALSALMTCSIPNRLVVTQSANNRLRKPINKQQFWSSTDAPQESLFCFDPKDLDQLPLSIAAQFTSPLLGRVHELGLMESSWVNVLEGEGKAVIVTGEAGMGKSRLIHEFSRNHSVVNAEHFLINCSCDPNRHETTLFPLIEGIKNLLSVQQQPMSAAISEFLKAHNFTTESDTNLFSWLLGVKNDKTSLFYIQQTPESLKYSSMAFLRRLVAQMATNQPVLFVIEDLHWADTSTIEWLDTVLSHPLPEGVFLILTGRPELFHRWRSYSVLNQLSLNRLSKVQARDLAKYLASHVDVEDSALTKLIERTEGNPLFIEEFLKTIADKTDGETITELSVFPDRLEDILLSRIDKLGGAKFVAQVAAVVGRYFDESVLLVLLDQKLAELGANLNRLLEAEVLFKQGHDQFMFKHALIRDALYGSINTTEKQKLHLMIANYLTADDSSTKSIPAETIAIHFSQGDCPEKSRHWWLRAVSDAENIFANTEVIRLCQQGLQDNNRCKAASDHMELEMRFQLALGKAVMSAKGYANSLAGEAHARAVKLGQQLNVVEQVLPSMIGLWSNYCVSAQHQKAQTLTAELVDYAEQRGDVDVKVEAYMCSGITAIFVGDIQKAKQHLELAISLYKPSMSLEHIRVYGQDPIVVLYSFYPIVEEALGKEEDALKSSDKCLEYAHTTNHPFSLGFALGFAVPIRIRQKKFEQVKALIAENKQLCEQHGIHVFRLLGAIQLGILQQAQGELEKGVNTLIENIPAYKAMGAQIFLPTWSAIIALSYIQLGKLEQAEREINQGKQQMQSTGEWYNKPILDFVSAQLMSVQEKLKVKNNEAES